MDARKDGAWLIGETDGFTEFTVIEHAEVYNPGKERQKGEPRDTTRGWHVRRSGSATTICGVAVSAEMAQKRSIYTQCWPCALELHSTGHAVWLPWSVLEVVEREYWKRRPAPATMITADA